MSAGERAQMVRTWLAALLPPARSQPPVHKSADEIADSADGLSEDDVAVLQLLNNEATRRLDGQRQAISQLDTKAAALVTLGITGIGLLLSGNDHAVSGYVAVASFGVLILLGTVSLAVRSWGDAPNPEVFEDFEASPAEQVYDRLVRAKAKAFAINRDRMMAKADWVKIATWWSSVPVVAAVVLIFRS